MKSIVTSHVTFTYITSLCLITGTNFHWKKFFENAVIIIKCQKSYDNEMATTGKFTDSIL